MAKTFQIKYSDTVLQGRGRQFQRNLAFSTAQAINKNMAEIQRRERIHIDRTFRVRQAGFIYRLIKIFSFASATKGVPFGEMGVDNSKQRTLLGLFEDGQEKQPAVGRNIAIPLTGEAARPDFAARVPDRMRVNRLQFVQSNRTDKAGQKIWIGRLGTYLLPGIGIFQRIGTGVSQLIYTFKSRAPIKPVLKLHEIAEQVFTGTFADTFTKIFNARKP
jgi:hypothetical protein